MNSIFIIDRIEADTMIVINQESGESLEIPHALAPHLSEGDAFSIQSEESKTADLLKSANDRLERLKAKSTQPKPGDIFDL